MYVEFLGISRERTGVAALELEARTLGDALTQLALRYPSFGELVSNGRLHRSLAANLNADVFVSDPATPIDENDRLLIVSADAGG